MRFLEQRAAVERERERSVPLDTTKPHEHANSDSGSIESGGFVRILEVDRTLHPVIRNTFAAVCLSEALSLQFPNLLVSVDKVSTHGSLPPVTTHAGAAFARSVANMPVINYIGGLSVNSDLMGRLPSLRVIPLR